jgi:hypothetical protein
MGGFRPWGRAQTPGIGRARASSLTEERLLGHPAQVTNTGAEPWRSGSMFSPEFRERVRNHILELARSDRRIIAGAAIGSDASGTSDRWSDLDLTFGLREGISPSEVLDEWGTNLEKEFGASSLFDLSSRATLYRVFLFPGNLQVDLSFTPGFAAEYGPRFKLLFGSAVKKEYASPRPAKDAFGYAVHHAVRARFSIERNHAWQAEYWISGVRDEALALACIHRKLEPYHGRGFDRLPTDVLAQAKLTLVAALDREELLRALGAAVELLLKEADDTDARAAYLGAQLRVLSVADSR